MTNQEWTWARLNREQIGLIRPKPPWAPIFYWPTERIEPTASPRPGNRADGLHVAALNESQLECLQGLEAMMQAVVIAYQQGAEVWTG